MTQTLLSLAFQLSIQTGYRVVLLGEETKISKFFINKGIIYDTVAWGYSLLLSITMHPL